jgi:DNA-binding transcriptional MerR regulator
MYFENPTLTAPLKKKQREMTWTIGQVANLCSVSKTTVKNFALMLGMKPANSTGKWLDFTRRDVERIAQVNQLTLRMHYKGIEKLIGEGEDNVIKTLDHFKLAVPRFNGGITND